MRRLTPLSRQQRRCQAPKSEKSVGWNVSEMSKRCRRFGSSWARRRTIAIGRALVREVIPDGIRACAAASGKRGLSTLPSRQQGDHTMSNALKDVILAHIVPDEVVGLSKDLVNIPSYTTDETEVAKF